MKTKIFNKLKKKREEFKQHGFSYSLKKLCRDHLYSNMEVILLKRDLNQAFPAIKNKKDHIYRLFNSEKDFPKMEKYFPHKKDDFSALLKTQSDCVVCIINEHIVAYFWISPRSFHDRFIYRYNFKLQPNEIYQFAGFISPKYRSTRGVLQSSQVHGWNYFKAQGFDSTIAAVEIDNKLSMKVHFKMGFKECGTHITVKKLLCFRWSSERHYDGEKYALLFQKNNTHNSSQQVI